MESETHYVKWTDALATGDQQVDDQHRALYDLVNDLAAESLLGERSERRVDAALERMLRYAAEHFTTEERLMDRSAYPNAAEHREEHRYYSHKATEMVAEHLAGHGLTLREISAFMSAWLETHIGEYDRPLIAHVREWRSN